ncbi:hypothetical protein PENTCL1PPCAC_20312, partial [Pristionchus entomophagus]
MLLQAPSEDYSRDGRETYCLEDQAEVWERHTEKASFQIMSELMGVQYTNQYGSPHALALILSRGAGEYYDWNDKNKVEEVGKRFICPDHERELGSDWEARHWYHFKRKDWKGGKVTPICSMPHPFFQHKPLFPLKDEVYRVEASEAEAILKKKGVLIHPGL